MGCCRPARAGGDAVPGDYGVDRTGGVNQARPRLGTGGAIALHYRNTGTTQRMPGDPQAAKTQRTSKRIKRGYRGGLGVRVGQVMRIRLGRGGTEKIYGVNQTFPKHDRISVAALGAVGGLLVGTALAARIERHHHVATADKRLCSPPIQGLGCLYRTFLNDHTGKRAAAVTRHPYATA